MFLINRIKKTFTRSGHDDRASTAPSTGPGSFRRTHNGQDGGTQSDRTPQRPHSSFSGPGGQEAPNTRNGPFQQAQAAAAAASSRNVRAQPATVTQAEAQQQAAMQQAVLQAAARKKKFEDLIPVIGDGPITAFCSTKWQERVEGLDTVGRMLRAKMHAKRVMGDDKGIALHFTNVCKLLHRALADKVTPVYFALVDLLNVTVECGLPKSDEVVQDGLRPLFPGMIKWMAVNNSRVQEKTLRAFVDFAQNDRIGVKFIAPMALAAYRSDTPSSRVVEARMTLLLGLLPVGSPDDFPADKVMKLCMPALESGDEKLRNMGVAVAAEAYRHHGKAVPVHTRHLPAGVLRLLDKKFVGIDKAKAAAADDPTGAAMEDDPLWLLRIQKNVGVSTGSVDDVHGPAQEAAGIAPRVTPRERAGAGMGAGAGAGYAARIAQPAQPRFKGHDWSKGPPVRRAGPAVAAARGSGVDTSRFVAPPSTTTAFGGGGGAGSGGGNGEASRSRAGSTGASLGAAGAHTYGGTGNGVASDAGLGGGGGGGGGSTWGARPSGGVGGGVGDTRRSSGPRTTTRTAAFGARIMGAGPGGVGSSPAVPDMERPRRRDGGRDGGWGGGGRDGGGGGGRDGGTRKWGTSNNRSVLSNTGAATFGSPVPKQAAPGPEGPATSSFLPNLGGDERPKRRNMDDDDEALMEDILSNL